MNNKPKIKIYGREVYGVMRFYPSDANADTFAALCGSKTFNLRQLDFIRALGFEIEVIETEAQKAARCGQ